MSGRWVKKEEPVHSCDLPGLADVRGVGDGSVWECDCGRRWRLSWRMDDPGPRWEEVTGVIGA